MKYSADFETSTWQTDETFVWAFALCEIGNEDNIVIGNNIDDFMKYVEHLPNSEIYFHNLKFDGEFIIHWLLTHGFTHITDKKERKDKTFSTLISDMGMFYSIEVYFKVWNKKDKKVKFIDSLKIIPFGVEQIAKSFGLPISKLEIDYNEPRELGHKLTKEETDYIGNDVRIVSMALKVLFDAGLTKITTASNALANYKETIGKSKFENLFPELDYEVDKDIRQSYKGGFTYLNPIYKEIDTGGGVVLDVNSLYPSVRL